MYDILKNDSSRNIDKVFHYKQEKLSYSKAFIECGRLINSLN